RYCYLRWGAHGKVRQLEQRHPHLREEALPDLRSTIMAPVEHLDLTTVLSVSETVAGELVLERLVDMLMRTAIEHAGAERGLLMLSQAHELRLQAEAITSANTITVRRREAPIAGAAVPESIIQYVARTKESVIIDDALVQGPFSADCYILQRRPRSILCLPLLKQAKLLGMLYLENKLTPHVFNPTRMAILRLLAA